MGCGANVVKIDRRVVQDEVRLCLGGVVEGLCKMRSGCAWVER